MDKAKFENKDIFWDIKKRRDAADMGCDDILQELLFREIASNRHPIDKLRASSELVDGDLPGPQPGKGLIVGFFHG